MEFPQQTKLISILLLLFKKWPMLNVCIVGSANTPSKLTMAKSKIKGYSYSAKLQSKKQQPGIFHGQFLRVQENHYDKCLIMKGLFDQLSVTVHIGLER